MLKNLTLFLFLGEVVMNTIKITFFALAILVTHSQSILSMIKVKSEDVERCLDYAKNLVCTKDISKLSDKDYDAFALSLVGQRFGNYYVINAAKNATNSQALSGSSQACKEAVQKILNVALKIIDEQTAKMPKGKKWLA